MSRTAPLALLLAAACSHPGAQAAAASSQPEAVAQEAVDAGAPDAGAGDDVLASLERTACFGRCPVYSVTVYRDGRTLYDGRANVGQMGRVEGKLTPEQLQALTQAFRDAHFFELQHQKTGRYTTDLAGANVTFSDGGKTRSIRDYHGDPGWPEELRKLEDRFDELAGTSRWVKGTE